MKYVGVQVHSLDVTFMVSVDSFVSVCMAVGFVVVPSKRHLSSFLSKRCLLDAQGSNG